VGATWKPSISWHPRASSPKTGCEARPGRRRRPRPAGDTLRLPSTSGIGTLLAGLTLTLGCARTDAPLHRPDIILITADTLRADHLGAYGYGRDTSPNFDAFSDDALLFENAFSHAPQTHTSFSSILTGFLPHETHAYQRAPLPAEVDTLAELLQSAGYSTHAVVSNYLLRQKSRWREGQGWAQGFDSYDDEMNQRELIRPQPERTARETTDRAIEIIRRSTDKPLFLWVHYQDPHGPYAAPPEFAAAVGAAPEEHRLLPLNRTRSGAGGIPVHQRLPGGRNYFHYVWQYDGEIRYFDHQLGRLISALKEAGLYDQSLILFTADHGEALGEHDFYFSHVGRLFHGLTHVPLVLKHGGRLSGRRQDYVQHLDVVPTLAIAAGIEPDPRLRGTDLRQPTPEGREIFAIVESPLDRDGERASLVVDGLKLVKNRDTQKLRLYDLRADPAEENDLSGDPSHRTQRKQLEHRLERLRHADRLALGAPQPEPLTDQEREALRALGYLD